MLGASSRKSTSFLKCRGADSGCTGVWHTRHAMPLDPTTRAVLEVVHQGGYTTTVIKHAGYVTFQMAEVAVPRDLFAAILERVQRFGVPPPLVQRG